MSDEDKEPDRDKEPEEGPMIIVLAIILAFILLDIAAVRWGANSTEKPDSKEWERRQRQLLV